MLAKLTHWSNPNPSKADATQALQRWASFISISSVGGNPELGLHDRFWGPYWMVTKCSNSSNCMGLPSGSASACYPNTQSMFGFTYDETLNVCVLRYPKESWRAGVIGRALLGIYNLTGIGTYRTWANNYYDWLTGNNEVGLDLQSTTDVYELGSPGKGGFWLGIGWDNIKNPNGPFREATINGLEGTAECGDFLVRLDDSSRGGSTWALAEFPSTSLTVAVLATTTCLIAVGSRSRKTYDHHRSRLNRVRDGEGTALALQEGARAVPP
jgi:hypothetical protein